jgi:hypothetical protein
MMLELPFYQEVEDPEGEIELADIGDPQDTDSQQQEDH